MSSRPTWTLWARRREVARIAAHFPETRLLILHRREEQAGVLEALRRGAWGHLVRETLGSEEVVEAIRTVAQGDACLNLTVAGRVVEEVVWRLRERRGEPEVGGAR